MTKLTTIFDREESKDSENYPMIIWSKIFQTYIYEKSFFFIKWK